MEDNYMVTIIELSVLFISFFLVGGVSWHYVSVSPGASPLWAIPVVLFVIIPALVAGAFCAQKIFH
jgi:apolipoprotein N-acyltransferase